MPVSTIPEPYPNALFEEHYTDVKQSLEAILYLDEPDFPSQEEYQYAMTELCLEIRRFFNACPGLSYVMACEWDGPVRPRLIRTGFHRAEWYPGPTDHRGCHSRVQRSPGYRGRHGQRGFSGCCS